MSEIAFLLTGGTIDSEAYPDPKHPPANSKQLPESLIPEALGELFPNHNFRIQIGELKDSKEITADDIAGWVKWINAQPEKIIIITHGTDRMAENSRALAKALKSTAKTVIMTGAMVPLANGREVTDGRQNLYAAVQHSAQMPSGVSVIMHRLRYNPEGLQKDFKELRFVNYTFPPEPLEK